MKNIFIFLLSALLLLTSCNKDSQNRDSPIRAFANRTSPNGASLSHDILITDVNIIDVSSGDILAERTVGINGERISKIYKRNDKSLTSSITVDGKNKFLIPGLWDMHIHYYWNYKDTAPYLVANGIVGVREMFGKMDPVVEMKSLMDNGGLIGPEIISSGAIIDGPVPVWPGSDKVANAGDAERVVKEQLGQGVDFLKVYSRLSRESYLTIARLAEQNNISFAGHIPHKVTIWEAISNNQKSIEHNTGILEAASCKADSIYEYYQNTTDINASWSAEMFHLLADTYSEKRMDSLISILSSSNTWLCPTMVVRRGMAYNRDSTMVNDRRQDDLPGYISTLWKKFPTDSALTRALRRNYELQKKQLKKMVNSGVKIIAGTDFPNRYTYPGSSLHDELEIFVEAGFTNLQAIQTATLNAAIFLEKTEDHGTIEESKYADMVLLDSNPLIDINNIKDINSVFLKGKYIAKEEIGRFLKN